jgi:putative tryptophan/tyrosine transport system substrate-binding protein
MKLPRRNFLHLAAGAAAAWPLAARGQQGERMRRIGVLMGTAETDPEASRRVAEFQRGLQAQGLIDGRNIRIEFGWAGSDDERIKTYAAELVATSPDVLVATNSPGVAALRQATHTVPIVFVGIGDPVVQGFVDSLARPGGNLTGFTGFEFTLGGKWVGLLKEIAPAVTRATYIFHPEIGPYYPLWLGSIEAAADVTSIELTAAPIRAVADIERVIGAVAGQPNGGLIVQPDSYTIANRKLIIELSLRQRLPAISAYRSNTADGGLMSYGPDVPDLYRRCAAYVDRILKGEKPGNLPIQQPTKLDLVINLTTAKALGLTVPPTLLARADEVIE